MLNYKLSDHWTPEHVVEEKAASLGFGVLGRPVTADGVSEKWRINRNTI